MEGIGEKIRTLINGVDKMDWDGITILRPKFVSLIMREFDELSVELHNEFKIQE